LTFPDQPPFPMNFMKSVYQSVSTIWQRDKSLNKKRANPFLNSSDAEERTGVESQDNPNQNQLPSSKSCVFDREERNLIGEQMKSTLIQRPLVKQQTMAQSSFPVKNNGDDLGKTKFQNKQEKGVSKPQQGGEDDEEIDDDLLLHKKRKISPCSIVTEEEGISKEWENEFKIIRKNLERMNNLFKFYEDSVNKKENSKEPARIINSQQVVKIS